MLCREKKQPQQETSYGAAATSQEEVISGKRDMELGVADSLGVKRGSDAQLPA